MPAVTPMKLLPPSIATPRRTPARPRNTGACRLITRNLWIRYAAALVASVTIFPLSGLQDAKAQDSTSTKLLVFRNIPSWNRSPDFEDACRTLKLPFDVKNSSEMKTTKLSNYHVIVIPGAQWETSFYSDFARSAKAFDQYVQDGGVLVFELNGAENTGSRCPVAQPWFVTRAPIT